MQEVGGRLDLAMLEAVLAGGVSYVTHHVKFIEEKRKSLGI